MKKAFRFIACLCIAVCAAAGIYIIVNRFLRDHKYKETGEFDDLYNEYMAQNAR